MGNPWRRGWISCKVKLLKWSRTLNSMLRQLQKTLTTISGLGYIQLHIFSLLQTDKSHCKITIDTNQFSLKSFKPKICFYIRNIFQFKVNYGNFFPYRAAAYGKIGEHQKAIEDCQKALSLDPNYGKAYGRMG